MSLKNALEAAGVKRAPVVSINVLNEHALAILNSALNAHAPCALRVQARSDHTLVIEIDAADGTPLPHSIVLDRRGTWHVKTYVGV